MTVSSSNLAAISLPIHPPEACKVLIADDDDRIVDAFSAILGRDGYQVVGATSGKAALGIVDSEAPDVIVLDVLMPDLSGIEVCRQVKANPRTRFVPVILITGMSARSQRLEGLNSGADDFISKPVDPLELTARVRSLLRTKQLYDQVEAHRRELEQRVAERTKELQVALDRLQELSRVKSNILAIVSHELRTPLHQAKSALKLATQDGIDDQKKAELIETVDKAFNQLEYRIGDIGTFSDPSDLKLSPTSVTDLIVRAVEQVRTFRRQEDDRIELDLPRGLSPVMVDANSMVRALAHLIDNAVKFGEGQPIHVSATEKDDGILIVVQDEGKGLSDAVKPYLFVPLQPGDSSPTRQQDGLGIGLALVKLILDAHGIKIDIQSETHKGTTVSLLLPLAEL
jgi:two-component system sensor histidine kinase/response regulator